MDPQAIAAREARIKWLQDHPNDTNAFVASKFGVKVRTVYDDRKLARGWIKPKLAHANTPRGDVLDDVMNLWLRKAWK